MSLKRAPPERKGKERMTSREAGDQPTERNKKMKNSNTWKRIMAFVLSLVMALAMLPADTRTASAATTASVSLSSLGNRGNVTIGSKTKSGTWWQMNLNGKKAFCINLGYTCHSGNTYAAEESYNWNQDTKGEKHGPYAKVIRWYVLDKNRSTKAFVMAQALIWSIAEGRTSEADLKDVIKQVKDNTNVSPNKTAAQLYKDIFEPSGNWTASVTYWQKTGNSKSYQKLMTVDADEKSTRKFTPKTVSDSTRYRQRVTVNKVDEDGNGLGNIQFTLSADNLDDLYGFAVIDRNGTDESSAGDDDDTEFSLTGQTKDNGRLAFRMTYKLVTMDYYYYTDADLAKMTADEKKAAKKTLEDDMELEQGKDFAADMTKASAEKLMEKEMKELKGAISNTYTLTEDNTGDNPNIAMDPELAKGVKITLDKDWSWEKDADGAWPDVKDGSLAEYSKAYITGVTNHYKKASIDVVKVDKYSSDRAAHGDAALDGAQFMLYADEACTDIATVYDASGNMSVAGTYTVSGGKLVTDYLKSGATYYLKETNAPAGYTLSNDILPITVDASGVTAEYTADLATVEYGNQPVLGKIAIQKYYTDEDEGLKEPEAGTTFQVYLKSKGSYDACDEYERAEIKTDEKGHAVTGDLYYGTYTVHQVDSGDVDTILVEDFDVEVAEDGKTYEYELENRLFKAYLKIIKRDGNTDKTVLKPGTSYQIYRVMGDGEKLVEQSYEEGGQKKTISTFTTDESGEVMTLKPLRSATYRIYETDTAGGLHIKDQYVEFTFDSKADNFESYTDKDGAVHALIVMTYTNEETKGLLKVYKTGEMLTGFQDGKFIYESRMLKGAVFEVRASEDIMTQDGQGTKWYEKGELVATITTGVGAVFIRECRDITSQSVDKDGTVSVTLPLGKYHVTEKKAVYGYLLPEKGWDVEFTWHNKDEESVINSTDATDREGVLRPENMRAKAAVSLIKTEPASGSAIEGAQFGIYTRNDIYNADGQKIVEAGTLLGTVSTGADGRAAPDLDLPLMGQGYTAPATGGSFTPAAATAGPSPEIPAGSGAAISSGNAGMNSGDYYMKELAISGSYFLGAQEYPFHLEYQGERTAVVSAEIHAENTPTTTNISKQSVTGSSELDGCHLKVTDEKGNVIVSWVSGEKESVSLKDGLESMGYSHVAASLDKDGHLQVKGLLHDTTYTLTETRPADGYVTADSISFQVTEGEGGKSLVAIVGENGDMELQKDDMVRMADEKTHIRLIKLDAGTGQGLKGARIAVYDSHGKKVMEFISSGDGNDITGKLAVGETYTFKETEAPRGYKLAAPVKLTIKDTAKVQKVSMTDEKEDMPPAPPQTGDGFPFPVALAFVSATGYAFLLIRSRKAQP